MLGSWWAAGKAGSPTSNQTLIVSKQAASPNPVCRHTSVNELPDQPASGLGPASGTPPSSLVRYNLTSSKRRLPLAWHAVRPC